MNGSVSGTQSVTGAGSASARHSSHAGTRGPRWRGGPRRRRGRRPSSSREWSQAGGLPRGWQSGGRARSRVEGAVATLGPLEMMINNRRHLDGYFNVDETDEAVWRRVDRHRPHRLLPWLPSARCARCCHAAEGGSSTWPRWPGHGTGGGAAYVAGPSTAWWTDRQMAVVCISARGSPSRGVSRPDRDRAPSALAGASSSGHAGLSTRGIAVNDEANPRGRDRAAGRRGHRRGHRPPRVLLVSDDAAYMSGQHPRSRWRLEAK